MSPSPAVPLPSTAARMACGCSLPLQLTPMHKVAKPVNGKPGDDVIIAGSVSDKEAKKISPQGWKAPKP